MPNKIYPKGFVRDLLQSHFVTPQTAVVLNERLQTAHRISPTFFRDETFRLAESICDCLFPQEGKEEKIAIAILFEKELATGKGKGWRYAELPPVKEAMVQGIEAIEEETQTQHQTNFVQLPQSDKETLLASIQKGEVKSNAWKGLPSAMFFTELLTMLTEIYYSHPLAKEEIGDASFADEGGWHKLGLNNLEGREPQRITSL